jgi:hypothetical protein
MTKANKSSTAQKRKLPSVRVATDMEKKVTKSFARQIEAFIKRYRSALEALAKH